MLDWIKQRTIAAWRYSRIVFINVATALAMVSGDLFAVLLGYDWATVLSSQYAGLVVLALNIVNVLLRINLRGSAGTRAQ